MDKFVRVSDVIDWFRVYGHMDEKIPFDVLITDLKYSIPAADAAPVVHGEWMRHSNKLWCYCSVCLEDALMSRSTGAEVLSETCPNCGAKMDGGTTP